MGATTTGPDERFPEEMRGPGSGKGGNRVRPGNAANLSRKRVGVGTRGNVNGQHLSRGTIDGLDCLGVKPGYRRTETGSQESHR